MMEVLNLLQNWYLNNCNGEWEHGFGIKIITIDNPGWLVEINLIGTMNENIKFENIKIERTENDWVHCWVEKEVFNVACGPLNLEEALVIFIELVKGTRKRN